MNDELRNMTVLTAGDVQKLLRIGKNKTYDFLNDENCPVPIIKIDHQIRVPARQFFEWLDNLKVAAV